VANTGLGASVLVPTLTTRRVSTTVELREGQSLAIGGLLSDNFRESVNRFPVLGEIPILGALFRSSEFQKNKTELLIVVTPRLVKPLPPNFVLPTDNFKEPSRSEFFFGGKMEAAPPEPPTEGKAPQAAEKDAVSPQQDQSAGFEMK
jgi:pilus assembly protein CpaC